MHNNFYHKGKKILFTSMAVAALSVIAVSPVAAKAAEAQKEQPVKPAETKSTTNNDKDQKTDIEDHTAEDDSHSLWASAWIKGSYSYDEKTKTFTIKNTGKPGEPSIFNNEYTVISGQDQPPINPAQIAWNVDDVNTDEIETIKIEDGPIIFKGDASSLFANLPNLKKIEGLNNLDTTDVTSMKQMFANDPKLTSLDLSKFDTSKVTDMMGMFTNDSSLTSLDVSHFNTEKVTDMSYMFAQVDASNEDDKPSKDAAPKLTEIKGLDKFDTAKVKRMGNMFTNQSALTSLDISNFKTPSEPVPVKGENGKTTSYSEPAETDMLKGLDSLTSLKLGKDNIIKSSGLNTKGTWNLNGKNLTSDEFASQFDGSKDANTFTLTPASNNVTPITPSTPSTPSTPVTPSTPSTPVAPSTPSTPVVPSNNVTPKPNTNVKKGVKRIVTHNAYIFNQSGVRVSGEFYVGDSITTYGTKYINGKKFYDLGNDRFVKANNVTGINRKLKHNAYIYTKKNKKVKRLGRKVLKKNKKVRTYGGAVKMHNKWYYIIGKNQFVKKANFR
ncbi:SLAP domain-containing protein [uncultured Lactobacillus sp.]|uniref:SLAP domain-containing protein n=1 Tax=uncultured Lactobacillus sp. TaxID=153152 RepID=UPI0025F5C834|nr:SLAP domain-containing protein [uncultured Lactobacillus sp.]